MFNKHLVYVTFKICVTSIINDSEINKHEESK